MLPIPDESPNTNVVLRRSVAADGAAEPVEPFGRIAAARIRLLDTAVRASRAPSARRAAALAVAGDDQ